MTIAGDRLRTKLALSVHICAATMLVILAQKVKISLCHTDPTFKPTIITSKQGLGLQLYIASVSSRGVFRFDLGSGPALDDA